MNILTKTFMSRFYRVVSCTKKYRRTACVRAITTVLHGGLFTFTLSRYIKKLHYPDSLLSCQHLCSQIHPIPGSVRTGSLTCFFCVWRRSMLWRPATALWPFLPVAQKWTAICLPMPSVWPGISTRPISSRTRSCGKPHRLIHSGIYSSFWPSI